MDYKKIGFKAGLEIHQQLDSGKLFCHCPGYLRKDEPDYTIQRKLHKIAGETGEIDTAVLYEASLNKTFEYQGYNDTTCLVELDEEPPKEINEDALDEAIRISLLLNCEIVPITQVMRKTVVNGSNTSGFQRTTMIGQDGFIDTSFGTVGIDYVYLEEDAARIVSRSEKKDIYRLDRLGIPLVEIVTAPDAKNAEQVKELALKIGEVLRACKVKRGLGTIRQDINISIKGHPRTEIKGFQDPKFFITIVDKEIERQQNNLKEKRGTNRGGRLGRSDGGAQERDTFSRAEEELREEVRGALPSGETKFLRPLPGGARMYPETDLPLLKISRDRINRIKKSLPKLKSDIRDELKKKGLSEELINLVLEDNLDEFEVLAQVYEKDANLVAKMITLWRKELASKEKKTFEEIKETLTENILERILEEIKAKKIEKNDARKVMENLVKGKKIEDALKIEKVDHNELEEEIAKIVKEKPGLRPNAYMGLVMAKMKGKIDAKKAMEILKKLIE